MKDGQFNKTGELLLKIFIITVFSFLILVVFYSSINWTYNYFTMNDEQICNDSNSTLINGLCHSEHNTPVSERRNMLLTGGIIFPFIGLLIIVYLVVVIKYQFKEK